MLPGDAKLFAVPAGGIAIWDVSAILPRHHRKRYPTRDVDGIERLFFHHSGALGRDGFQGLFNSARYCVEDRNWPGEPYTYWLARIPDLDAEKRLVIYKSQHDEVRSYHTGGEANDTGVAACFQGNTSTKKMSDAQIEMAEALIPWLYDRHDRIRLNGPDGLSWHSESARYGGSGKPTCPGEHAEVWLSAYRAATRPLAPVSG